MRMNTSIGTRPGLLMRMDTSIATMSGTLMRMDTSIATMSGTLMGMDTSIAMVQVMGMRTTDMITGIAMYTSTPVTAEG